MKNKKMRMTMTMSKNEKLSPKKQRDELVYRMMQDKKMMERMMTDYRPDSTIFNEDSPLIDQIKRGIFQLPPAERIIFLLYCELGSYRKVAKMFGVTHPLVYKEVKMIKDKLLNMN